MRHAVLIFRSTDSPAVRTLIEAAQTMPSHHPEVPGIIRAVEILRSEEPRCDD